MMSKRNTFKITNFHGSCILQLNGCIKGTLSQTTVSVPFRYEYFMYVIGPFSSTYWLNIRPKEVPRIIITTDENIIKFL